MAALRTTSKGQLKKYIESTVERVEGSMTRRESLDASTGSFSVKDNKNNRDALTEFVKLARQGTSASETEAHNLVLEVKGSKPTLLFGQIEKPPGKPSRGDIGEAVIAAAICARFVYKHGRVTPSQVMGIMKTLGHKGIRNYPGKKGKYVEAVFKSKNKDETFFDDVHCYISLNESAITAALNPRSEWGKWAYSDNTCIPAYARSACNYANSGKVSKWAEVVYTNHRYDKIDIRSDGLGDQKGTKVDTRVKITDYEGQPQPVNINLSMKVDDVKQFGQVSGVNFSVQQELWKQVFGYTTFINNMETEFNRLVQEEHKLREALNMVYDRVAFKANRDIQTNKEGISEVLSKGITYFATRHEEDVEVLNLGVGGTKLYDKFENLYQALVDLENLQVTIRNQSNGFRQIDIKGKSPKNNTSQVLISIRLRRQPQSGPIEYIRNLIEKSKLLGELVAESLD